jgi:hypothetical protein
MRISIQTTIVHVGQVANLPRLPPPPCLWQVGNLPHVEILNLPHVENLNLPPLFLQFDSYSRSLI